MRHLTRRGYSLAGLMAVALLCGGPGRAAAEMIGPTDVRGIRVLGGSSPFLLQPGFLSVQVDPGFLEDRTVAVFDVGGLSGPIPSATLDLNLTALDPGGPAGVIDVFAFAASSGAVTPALFNAGTFLTSVSVNQSGLVQVDVTSAVQAAVSAGQPFLGFRLSTTGEDRFVSGPAVGRSNPALNVAGSAVIPEPSTFVLLALGALGLLGYGWRHGKWVA